MASRLTHFQTPPPPPPPPAHSLSVAIIDYYIYDFASEEQQMWLLNYAVYWFSVIRIPFDTRARYRASTFFFSFSVLSAETAKISATAIAFCVRFISLKLLSVI